MSWGSDTNANKFKKSYIQGFLDVSGGNLIVESSSTIQVMSSAYSGQAALLIKPDRFSVFTGQSSYDISYVTFAALGYLGASYEYTTADVYNRIQFIGSSTLLGNKTFVGSDTSYTDLVVYGNVETKSNGNLIGMNNLLLTGDASLNQKLYVANTAWFNSDISVNGRATVNGDVSLNKNLDIGTGNNSVAINKDISANVALDVSGTTIFRGSVSINQDVSFNQTLRVGTDLSVNRYMYVGNNALFNTDVSVNQNLYVAGKASIGRPPANTAYELDVSGQQRIYETTGTRATATAGSLVFEHGDASGVSSIVFLSKNNAGSDFAYIQYEENVGGASEKGLLTIGVENDLGSNGSADRLSLYAAGGSGFIGVNTKNPLYSLDISGTTNISNGSLFVSTDISLNKNLYVGQDVSINRNLAVQSRAIVSGDVSLNQNVKLGSGINSVAVNKDISSNFALDVSGAIMLRGVTSTLSDISINGKLFVSSDASLNQKLFVSGDVSLNTNLSVGQALTVNNRALFSADVSLNNNTRLGSGINSVAVNKDISSNFALDVSGTTMLRGVTSTLSDVSINGKLFVSSDVSLNQKLFVSSDASLNGNLSIGQTLTVNNRALFSADVSLNNNTRLGAGSNSVSVNKDISSQYALDVSGTTNFRGIISTISDISINGRLFVSSDVSLNQKLFVSSDASFNANLSIGQDLSINRFLYVTNNAFFARDVSINGNTKHNNSVSINKDISSQYALDVSGLTNFRGVVNTLSDISINGRLFVSSDVSLNQKLFVSSDASFNTNLYIGRDVSINRFLYVANNAFFARDVSMSQNLDIGSGNNSVSINKDISSQYALDVSGITNLRGPLYTLSDVSINGKLSVGGDISFNGNIALGTTVQTIGIGLKQPPAAMTANVTNIPNHGSYYAYTSSVTENTNIFNVFDNANATGVNTPYGYTSFQDPSTVNVWTFADTITDVNSTTYPGFRFHLDLPYQINLSRFDYRNTNSGRYPAQGSMLGSNNGTSWYNVYNFDLSGTYNNNSGQQGAQDFSFNTPSNTGFYSKYALVIKSIACTPPDALKTTTRLGISEIKLYGNNNILSTQGIGATSIGVSDNLTVGATANFNGNVTIGNTDNVYNRVGAARLLIMEPSGTAASATSGSLVLQHGDASGVSSIVFRSTNDVGSDYAYIQYQENVAGGASQKGLLTIGIQNDAGSGTTADRMSLYAASGSGFVGVNTLDPSFNLDISGNTNVSSSLFVNTIDASNVASLMTIAQNQTSGNLNIGNNASRSGPINIGTANTSKTITIGGSSTGTTTLQGGTITINPSSILEVGNNNASVAITIGRDQTSGALDIGHNASRTAPINIGTGSSLKTMSIGGAATTLQMYGVDASFAGNVKLGSGNKSVAINKDISAQYALDVSGDTLLRGVTSTLSDVSINGKLFVSSDVSLNQKLFVNSDVSFNANLSIGQALTVGQTLTVNNRALFSADVSLNNNTRLGAGSNSVSVNKDISSQYALDVSGLSNFRGIVSTLSDISINGRLFVSGDVSLNQKLFVSSDASLNANLSIGQDLSINRFLYVTNRALFSADVSINGNTKHNNSVSINKDISSQYALDVSGTTNFRGIISTLSDISINGRLFVSSDVSLNQKLFVNSDASLNANLSIGQDLSINRFLYVTNRALFSADVSINGNTKHNNSVSINKDISSNFALDVSGTTVFRGIISTLSDISINGRLFVSSDVSLNQKLFVSSDVSLNGNLSVGQTLTVNSRALFSADVSLNNNTKLGAGSNSVSVNKDISSNFALDVSGLTNFRGVISTLSDISINGRLFTSGDVSFNQKLFVNSDVSLNANLSVGQTLTVNNRALFRADVSLNNNTKLGAGSNSVSVNKDISSQYALDVSGLTNFRGVISTLSDISINGRLFVSSDVSLNQKLFVSSDVSLNANLSVGQTLTVNNRALFRADVSLNNNTKLGAGSNSVSVNKDISSNFALDVSGLTNFRGVISTLSDISINGRLFTSGDVSLNQKLFVNSDASLNANLSVGQALTVNSRALFSADVSLNNNTKLGAGSNSVSVNKDISSNFALDVSGTTVFRGVMSTLSDISINGRLFVSSDVSLNSKLFVQGDVSFNTNLYIGQDVSINRNLYVGNNALFARDVSMSQNLDIGSGNNSVSINKDISSNFALDVSGTTNLRGLLSTLSDVSLNGKLFVSTDVSLNSKLFVSSDVSINANVYIGQDVSINRNLYVANQTTLTNDVSMNRNVDIGSGSSSVAINKDISSNFALDVSGTTNLRGLLSTLSDVSLNGKLFVSTDVSLNQKLFTKGDASFNTNLYIGQDVSINRNLYVGNNALFARDVSMSQNLDIGLGNNSVAINKDISSNFALDISGETNMRGNLSLVGGTITVNGLPVSGGGAGTSLTTQGVKVGTDANYYVTVDKTNFYNDPSLVIYYNFDTSINSGKNIPNMAPTGSTYDASFNRTVTSSTTGMIDTTTKKYGGASLRNNPNLASPNVGIYVLNQPSIPISTTMTFSMWVNKLGTPVVGQLDRIFEYSTNTVNNGSESDTIALDINSSGLIIPVLTSVSSSCFGTLTSPILPYTVCDGSWNHIVWTITPSTSFIYINGSIKHYDTITTAVPTTSRTAAYIAFTNYNQGVRDFSGNIDEFRYYSGKALNIAEIYQLYNNSFFNLDICGGFLANGSSVIYEPVGSKATANSGTLTLLHGDASGSSSIMFKSVNDPLEYGYIQYEENSSGSTGYHYGLMTIGIENDGGSGNYTAQADRVSLFPSGGQGFVGVNTKTPLYSLDVSGTMRILEGAGTSASTTTGSLILEHTAVGGTSSIMFKGPNTTTNDYAYVQYTDASSVMQSLLKYDLSTNSPGTLTNATLASTGTSNTNTTFYPATDNSFVWFSNVESINGVVTPAYCLSFNQTNVLTTNPAVDPRRLNYLQTAYIIGSGADITFSVWVRPSGIDPNQSTTGRNYILFAAGQGTSGTGVIDIYTQIESGGNKGKLYCLINNDTTNYQLSGSTINQNAWNHIALSFSSTNKNGQLYLNNVPAEKELTGYSGKTLNYFDNFWIGVNYNATTPTSIYKAFRGQMAFINIFDKALSASDIAYLYNNPAYNIATNPERGLLTIGVENDTGVINNDRIVLWPGAGTGNVGINTKTPSTTLDISGTIRIYEGAGTPASNSSGSLILEHTAVGGTSSIMFKGPNTSTSDYAYVQYTDASSVMQSLLKYDLSTNQPALPGNITIASTGTNSSGLSTAPTDNSFAWVTGSLINNITPAYCLSFNQTNLSLTNTTSRINYLQTSVSSMSSFTFSAWIRPGQIAASDNSTPIAWMIANLTNSSNNGTVDIYLQDNGYIFALIGDDNTNYITTNSALVLNTWYHLVFTFDANLRNGFLYLNGSLNNAVQGTTGLSGKALKTNSNLLLGLKWGWNTGTSSNDVYGATTKFKGFRGQMAFVNVFDRGISAADVQFLYNNPAYNIATNPERGLLTIGVENDTGVINNDRIVLWPGAGTGNVGINTRTPSATLDISGSLNVSSTVTSNNGTVIISGKTGAVLRLANESPIYNSSETLLDFYGGESWRRLGGIGCNDRSEGFNGGYRSSTSFYTTYETTYNLEAMRITGKSQTLANCATLKVYGDVDAVSYNASSDYRIKTNVMPLDLSFTVDVLNPVSYVLKDDTEAKKQIGFIAHEVQEYYPFLVNGQKDGPNTQSINYNGFIGILTKEIKDLKATVSAQDARLTAQDARLEVLEKLLLNK